MERTFEHRARPRVGRVLIGAIAVVVDRNASLVKALLLPAILMLLLQWFWRSASSSWLFYAAWLTDMLVYTLFAVAVHRIVLLGEEPRGPFGLVLQWGKRQTLFLGYFLLLSLVFLGTAQLGAALSYTVLRVALMLLAMYAWVRLSLIFPATADDESFSLRTAWRVSANHQWYLFFVVFLVPVVIWIAPAMILKGLEAPWPVVAVVDLIELAMVVAALSVAYSEIRFYELGQTRQQEEQE